MAQEPMYQRIAEDLRKKIESGDLAQGSQLPTELELRERYDNASRNTVRDAVKRLISQGLVETKPGQGTFVTVKADPFVTILTGKPDVGEGGTTYLSQVSAEHRRPRTSLPRVEVLIPSAEVARRLRIQANNQVVCRHEERFIDEIPWSLQTSFYPWEFIERGARRLLMADDIKEGAVSYLGTTIDLNQVGYRDWITARSPDSNEQAFFAISHEAAVFENFRTAFDQHGDPMRVTVTVFPIDRNQFIVNVGRVPNPQYGDESTDSESV